MILNRIKSYGDPVRKSASRLIWITDEVRVQASSLTKERRAAIIRDTLRVLLAAMT